MLDGFTKAKCSLSCHMIYQRWDVLSDVNIFYDDGADAAGESLRCP